MLPEAPSLWKSGLLSSFDRLKHGVTVGRFDVGYSARECDEQVVSRRRRVCDAMALPFDRLTVGEQVHGAGVTRVTAELAGGGRDRRETRLPLCDGLVTDLRNVPLMVLSADCALLLVFDPVGAVGVAHAGWRGVVLGTVAELVRAMGACFSSEPSNLWAAVSPAAGACCYEIGDDVIRALERADLDAPGVVCRRDGSAFLDLAEANRRRLVEAGLLADRIDIAGVCTICNHEYFSYRREGAGAGRFGLVAAVA